MRTRWRGAEFGHPPPGLPPIQPPHSEGANTHGPPSMRERAVLESRGVDHTLIRDLPHPCNAADGTSQGGLWFTSRTVREDDVGRVALASTRTPVGGRVRAGEAR